MEFFAYTKRQGGAKILIHKNIPVAAGLAGGSGNGAAVLCALDLLYGTRLTLEELFMLGQRLGADVPYCITGGTQLAKGIGEQLTPLPPLPKTTVLLVKPPINVSTPAIYAQMDAAPIPERPDKAAMLAALAAGDVPAVSGLLCNVMEQVTRAQFPVIGGIKKKLLLNGALGASMSGSGPTVFGFFRMTPRQSNPPTAFLPCIRTFFSQRRFNKKQGRKLICTPKVRHFWRCIFLWRK